MLYIFFTKKVFLGLQKLKLVTVFFERHTAKIRVTLRSTRQRVKALQGMCAATRDSLFERPSPRVLPVVPYCSRNLV